MQNQESLFKQFQPMIMNRVWFLSKKYHLDSDDLTSQGYYVFVKTFQRYNAAKSSFSTYLYSNLKDLENYSKREYRKIHKTAPLNVKKEEDFLIDFHLFENTIFQMEAKAKLSNEAQEVLKFILNREWETQPKTGNKKVSITKTIKEFRKMGFTNTKTRKAWEELKSWWNYNYCYF